LPEARSAVFARQVRRLREARGWSQGEFARRLADVGHPIGQSRVSTIEAPGPDPRTVSVDQAAAFAEAFGVPLEQLLTDSHLWVTRDFAAGMFAATVRVEEEAAGQAVELANATRRQAAQWLAENDLELPEQIRHPIEITRREA